MFVWYIFSGRNFSLKTNAIHVHSPFKFILRPENSWRNIPSNTIQIQYTVIVHSNFPAGIFRQIQNIIYTCCSPTLSGENIPNNTNKIHLQFSSRKMLSIQIQHTLGHCSFSSRKIPAGIFRPIQIQYIFIVVVFVLYLISGRNK